MVWRLVLSSLLHLTLLLFLAIFLELSLNSVQHYAPIANPQEFELENLDTTPALLGAMDAERRAYQKSGDPRDLALYAQTRQTALANLDALNIRLLLASPDEKPAPRARPAMDRPKWDDTMPPSHPAWPVAPFIRRRSTPEAATCSIASTPFPTRCATK